MNPFIKLSLLLLTICIIGIILSAITNENVIVCDIYIMLSILLFNDFKKED